jgi:tetratricopeptide (TPR) repeat protein/CHAT domain-containing protein
MARDYGACVTAALEHSEANQRHDIIQLLSIALHRLGLAALAGRVADWAMAVSAGTPYQALLAFTAGRIDLPSARAIAARAAIQDDLEFYAACRFSTLGQLDLARETFERLRAHRPRSFESILAGPERLLRGISADASATPDAQQIAMFARSVDRLHALLDIRHRRIEIDQLVKAGEIDKALTRSRQLSASLAGQGDAFAQELATTLNNTAHILFTRQRYEDSLPYYERALSVLRSDPQASDVLLGGAANNLGNLYRQLGRHADSIRLQLEALAARRAANGDVHPHVLLSLLDLGQAHEAAAEPETARERYDEALAIVGQGLSELKPFVQRLRVSVARAVAAGDYVSARSVLSEALRVWETKIAARKRWYDLHALARLRLEAGDLTRAEANLREALGQLGTNPELDRVAAAECLYDLGKVEEARGQREIAAERYSEALDLLDQTRTSPLLAAILLAMARVGDQRTAEDSVRKALRVAEAADAADVQAAAWHELGMSQQRGSRLDDAHSSFEHSLALRRPDDSWGRVQDLVQLAGLAIADSRLDAAEAWLSEAEALIATEQPVQPSSPATCLQLRGKIALARHRRDEALESLRAALERQSRDAPSNASVRGSILADVGPLFMARGEMHIARTLLTEAAALLSATEVPPIETGLVHISLATCEHSLGLLAPASETIRKAHDLLVPVLGPDHLVLGTLWSVAGSINLSAGAHKTAEEQLRRARRIYARAGTSNAQALGRIDASLALLQHLAGRWQEALATATQAAEQLAASGLLDVDACKWQAFALAALGRREAALETMLQRMTRVTDDFRRTAATLPTSEIDAACGRIARVLDEILSLAVDPELSRYAPDVFAAVQRSKAIAAEAFAVQRDIVAGSANEDVRRRWREIAELRSLIGRTLLQKPAEPLTADERGRLAGWETRVADLERDLLRGEAALDVSNRFQDADAGAIAAHLSPDELLVEYVRFESVDFRHPATNLVEDRDTGRYCAFAVRRTASGTSPVELFDLGRAADLEAMVQEFRTAIVNGTSTLGGHGRVLGQKLLDPILAGMGEPKALLIAADGALYAMPFDALTWTDGRWLLDAVPVSFVDVARDLLRFGQDRTSHDPMVIAAPDFNLREVQGPQTPTSEYVAFEHLEGAEREGRAVAARLGVEPLMGARAVESTLRSIRSPRILHLATHGFFIPKARYEGRPDVFESITILDVPGEGRYVVGAQRPMADDDPESLVHPSRLENPLLRYGLVQAGANTWLAGGILPVQAEDCVVTGLDLAGLD